MADCFHCGHRLGEGDVHIAIAGRLWCAPCVQLAARHVSRRRRPPRATRPSAAFLYACVPLAAVGVVVWLAILLRGSTFRFVQAMDHGVKHADEPHALAAARHSTGDEAAAPPEPVQPSAEPARAEEPAVRTPNAPVPP